MIESWMALTDYSTKYKVSISTIRRRIKNDSISFRFEDGKYLIQDEPMGTHPRVHRPSPLLSEDTQMGAPRTDQAMIETMNSILIELKKAYTQILQEKEEQIFQLREEAADLKTLVRVLEGENKRLTQC
jgi:hypothetical protein